MKSLKTSIALQNNITFFTVFIELFYSKFSEKENSQPQILFCDLCKWKQSSLLCQLLQKKYDDILKFLFFWNQTTPLMISLHPISISLLSKNTFDIKQLCFLCHASGYLFTFLFCCFTEQTYDITVWLCNSGTQYSLLTLQFSIPDWSRMSDCSGSFAVQVVNYNPVSKSKLNHINH